MTLIMHFSQKLPPLRAGSGVFPRVLPKPGRGTVSKLVGSSSWRKQVGRESYSTGKKAQAAALHPPFLLPFSFSVCPFLGHLAVSLSHPNLWSFLLSTVSFPHLHFRSGILNFHTSIYTPNPIAPRISSLVCLVLICASGHCHRCSQALPEPKETLSTSSTDKKAALHSL